MDRNGREEPIWLTRPAPAPPASAASSSVSDAPAAGGPAGPLDPKTPLVLLLDGRSASASEVRACVP